MEASENQKQDLRTFLRERFLRLCAHIPGQEAFLSLHENTKVSCKLGHIDIDVQHIQTSELKTPMGTIPDATLRTSDVISIKIPDLNTQPMQ